MIEEGPASDPLAGRACAMPMSRPIQERPFCLRGGDGRCGLCKSGGGHQGDEHEFRFHGWYELRLGWLDLSLIREPPLALVAATKPSWIAPLNSASFMPAASS